MLLETPRLRLEPIDVRHADALFEGLRDERLYEFIREQPPVSASALRARYRQLSSRKSPDGSDDWLNWALWSHPDRRYIGFVQATVRNDRSAEIAYVLFRDDWGKGYAREAVTAMLEHLGDHYFVSLVRAHVDTRNRRSIALLEALGFERVAIRPGGEWNCGVLSDEAEYRLVLEAVD